MFFGVIISAPVLAQDNVIRIINDDGTETVVELPGATKTPPPPSVPEKVQEPVVKKIPARPPVFKPEKLTPKKAAKPAAPEKIQKAAVQKPVAVKPPKKKPDTAPAPLKKESVGKVMEKPQPQEIPQGTVITEKLAKRVALEIAPPARNITVLERSYEDQPVYLVRFKTDAGFYDVLVSRENGQIVATKDVPN